MLRHGIMASSPNNFLLSDDDEEDVVVVAVGEDMHLFEGDPPNLACCRVGTEYSSQLMMRFRMDC